MKREIEKWQAETGGGGLGGRREKEDEVEGSMLSEV